MQFHIENMTCDGCARGVTKAIQSVDPSAGVEADLPTRNVVVTTSQPQTAFAGALAAAGFVAVPVGAGG